MDGVAGNGDGRADILFGHFANMGIGMAGAGFLALFQRNLNLFGFARRFAHRFAPCFKFVALCATPLALAGCTGELSTLDPAGPRAANLATLWWIMLAGATALFTLVMVLFALVWRRSGPLKRITPAQWIIGGGLVLPIPVLVLLTGTALVLGEQLLPHGTAQYRVEAEGRQWHWRFSYPDAPAMGASTVLHLPVGVPVDIAVTSADVIHSFWVPRLGGKIDAIPGHTNVIRLQVDTAGTYWGQNAEYNGIGHDSMIFRVEAHAPEDFAALMEGGE